MVYFMACPVSQWCRLLSRTSLRPLMREQYISVIMKRNNKLT